VDGKQQFSVHLRNDSSARRRISLQGLGQQQEIGGTLAGGELWALVSPHGPDPIVSQRLIEARQGIGLVVAMAAPESGEAKVAFALAFQELDPATGHECGKRQVLLGSPGGKERWNERGADSNGETWTAVLHRGPVATWLTLKNGASLPRMICVRSILMEHETGATQEIWSAKSDCANSPNAEVVREGESTSRLISAVRGGIPERIVIVAEVGADEGEPHRVISVRTK
jgi:hypothetical protein